MTLKLIAIALFLGSVLTGCTVDCDLGARCDGESTATEKLTIQKVGTGSGTVSPAFEKNNYCIGLSGLECSNREEAHKEEIQNGFIPTCGEDCVIYFEKGLDTYYEAIPDSNSTFTKWIGCTSVSEENQCYVLVNDDMTIQAEFSIVE